jgi:hypothetical protein
MAGQSVGMVKQEQSVADTIGQLVDEAAPCARSAVGARIMALGRRSFRRRAALAAGTAGRAAAMEDEEMFGWIGKMRAASGQRDRLIAICSKRPARCRAASAMSSPGTRPMTTRSGLPRYGTTAKSHRASLQLPQVQAAVARARPLIAGFDSSTETVPVGGAGLPARSTEGSRPNLTFAAGPA